MITQDKKHDFDLRFYLYFVEKSFWKKWYKYWMFKIVFIIKTITTGSRVQNIPLKDSVIEILVMEKIQLNFPSGLNAVSWKLYFQIFIVILLNNKQNDAF